MAQGGARGGLTPSVFIAVFLMSVSVCPRAVLAVECWRYGTLPCTFGNCTFSFVDAATANELKREGTCTSTGDTLYIHNLNFLDTVQPGVFSNMPATMKNLHLDKNPSLPAIDNQIFADLVHVETLNLAGSGIVTISDQAFAAMPNLKELDLGQNRLASVGAQTFAGHPKLRMLFLGSNRITSMDSNWNAGLTLTTLDLAGNPSASNELTCLPGTSIQHAMLTTYSGVTRCCAQYGNSQMNAAGNCVCGAGAEGLDDSACTGCPAGKFKGTAGPGTCLECTDPHALPNLGSPTVVANTVCQCKPGSIGPDNGTCTLCDAGKYVDVQGAAVCVLCPAGTFSTKVGANTSTLCASCPAASSSPAGSDNQDDCTCNVGTTGPNGGACIACDAGKYKAKTGSDACDACPANSHSPSSSRAPTDCTCKAGFMGPAGGPCNAPCSVALILVLNITQDVFTADKQALFRQAMADTVEVPAEDVSIHAVNETADMDVVSIIIEVAIETWKCAPPQTPTPFVLEDFNQELAKVGLPGAHIWKAADTLPPGFVAAPIAAIVGGIVGAIVAVVMLYELVVFQIRHRNLLTKLTKFHDAHVSHASAIKRLHSILEQHHEHKHHAEELRQMHSEKVALVSSKGSPGSNWYKLSAVFPTKGEHHDVHGVRLKTEHENELEKRLHAALTKATLFQDACQNAHSLHAAHSSAIKRLHSILEQHTEHQHHAEELKRLHLEKEEMINSHKDPTLTAQTTLQITDMDEEANGPELAVGWN